MEPSIVIIGLIVVAVIALVVVMRSRRKGEDTPRFSSPTRPRPSASAASGSEDEVDKRSSPDVIARGWGSKEEDEPKSAPPQQAPVQHGGYPIGGMTGPTAASGGVPLPPAEKPIIDEVFVPRSAAPNRPINPPPLPPLQPEQPTPPAASEPPTQWQSAEPPASMFEEVPPPPIPQAEGSDDDESVLPLEPLEPEPAKAALDDEPFGSVADDDAKPAAPPAPPITRGIEHEELEAAPPSPVPQPSAETDEREKSPSEPTREPIAAVPKSEVNFTAFYPRTAQATQRYGLFIYAHLPTALTTVQTDAQKFTSELGGNVPAPRTTKQPAQIADGQPITITPECDGLTFDPPTLTKRWDAPYVRYEFDFKATADQIGDELQGRAMIAVAGIEVAQLKFTIEVIALGDSTTPAPNTNAIVGETPQPPSLNRVMNVNSLVPPPNNPLAAAKSMAQTEPTKIYTKIFISYSRKDKAVAEAYRLAQLALGNDVFMDTYSIRTGEDWRVALARAIDSADVFQLFWSENSATSDNVRDEWDYALHYRCPDSKCADFIRPVFWIPPDPNPKPPTELSHLNFRFVPLVQD